MAVDYSIGKVLETSPELRTLPLETPPLPAQLPTNVFFVGAERFVLIDPAPRPAAGQARLFEVIDKRCADGDEFVAVVLTHHHIDHVGALEATLERYGVPLWAHSRTAELLERSVDRTLEEGDVLELSGRSWQVLFTPGHAQGHLAFLDAEASRTIVGDLVSTLVSMYVGVPGGDLHQYFESLERLIALAPRELHPSHGPPTSDAVALLKKTLAHRRRRIEAVYSILGEKSLSPSDVARRLYPQSATEVASRGSRATAPTHQKSTDAKRWAELTERTTRAALEYLRKDGRAASGGDDDYRRSAR